MSFSDGCDCLATGEETCRRHAIAMPFDLDDVPTVVLGPLPPGWWRNETVEGEAS
jgi:hypothetical protein